MEPTLEEGRDFAGQKTGVTKRAAGVFALVVAVFMAGVYIGIHQTAIFAQTQDGAAAEITSIPGTSSITLTMGGDSAPSNVDLAPLWRTWELLNSNFVKVHASTSIPTEQEQVYGAIQGLVDSYGDQYTTFFPPADAKMFDDTINGSFSGVGMEIGVRDGVLTVVAPLKGSPAEAAGIRPGDKILAVDATEASHLSVDEAVRLIRGEKGTTVKVTVLHAGESQSVVIPIVRDTINVPSITYTDNTGSKIFEIDLSSFSALSSDEFRSALRAFFQSGDTRLLLDLRGNPGGYLDAAVDMASYFLPVGSTVVTEDFNGKQTNIIHRSVGYDVFKNKKLTMVILIDEGSASASEILAGALQQHGVATLVGTRSFGKGSVQQLFDIGGGAQVKITVARWLTPDGMFISDGGLTPDINATTTAEDFAAGRDPQKDAAIQFLVNH